MALLSMLMILAVVAPELARPPAVDAQGRTVWARTDVWPAGFDPETLLDPQGVDAAPGGGFFVADRGHDRVVLIDDQGRIQRSIGGRGDGPDELHEPRDVAVDAARDRLYVVDGGNRRISVFRIDGTPVARWRTGGPDFGFVPYSVAVSPASGEVYVLNRLPWGFVDRYDGDGNWLGGWGDIGDDPGDFRFPEDVAVHPDGRVLVADTNNDRIQVFDATGAGVEDVLPVSGVRALAVESGGAQRIFALHQAPAQPTRAGRVTIFGADGSEQARFDSGLTAIFEPGIGLGVAGGRFAVSIGFGASDGLHALRQLDATGGSLRAATESSPLGFPGFLEPLAIDSASDGTLHVLDRSVDVTRRYAMDRSPRPRLDAAGGDEITVAADGTVYSAAAPVLGDLRVRRIEADGRLAWEKRCDCLSGLGLTATSDRVLATDAYNQQLGVFDLSPANDLPIQRFTVANAPYAWPLDVDSSPSGQILAAGGADGFVHVIDPRAGPLSRWSVTDRDAGAERISVADDGRAFVLRFDGRIAVYDAARNLLDEIDPQPAPGETHAMLVDVAAGPNGRLYALDLVSRAVFVYEPRTEPVMPTATPPSTPPCSVTGDKRAAPARVRLGEPVQVELSLDIECRPGTEQRADIVLILDRSNSMAGDKLDSAVLAASRFIQGLDLSRHRVGLVSFSDVVSLDERLTADETVLLQTLRLTRADGRTDIAGALERALLHLGEAGRPDAQPVMLLLTDGNPSRPGQPYVDAVRLGARARARGALTFAIGLGEDVDDSLLTAVVGQADRYFFAPQASDLDPIYDLISATVGEVVATDLVVTDQMGADVRYTPASALPPAASEALDTVTWTAAAVPASGLRFTLEVVPQRVGTLPTNTLATAEYTADGQRYSFTFPIPEVEVLEPPTTAPGTIYLPILMRRLCLPEDQAEGVDVVLVIDTSSSMEGEKLDAAVAAAGAFLDAVDPRRDRVGLVSFDSEGRREYLITADLPALRRRLAQLQPGQGTRIDLGLEAALQEIRFRGRQDTPKVIVLLSDGQPQAGTEAATLGFADEARALGHVVFTIGLGTDLDADFMRVIAGAADRFYAAPEARDLAGIYERIAGELPCR